MGERSDEIASLPQTEDSAREDLAINEHSGVGDLSDSTTEQEERLRADIERTRAGMSSTLDALQEKLSPDRIMEQVKEKVHEQAADAYDTAKHAVREATIGKAEKFMDNVSGSVGDATRKVGMAMEDFSLYRSIRENPLPFALITAGLGMLAMSKRGQGSYRRQSGNGSDYYRYGSGYNAGREGSGFYGDYDRGYRAGGYSEPSGSFESREQSSGRSYYDSAKETVSNVADRTKDAVSSAAGTIKETAGKVADTTKQQVDYLKDQADQGMRVAGDTFEDLLRDYPLAVGAAALALGAAVGLALPATDVEREYMGEAREQFVGKAQEVAKSTVEKVQRVAHEAGEKIREQAQNEGLTAQS